MRRPDSLATRAVLAGCLVALISVVVTALVAVPLAARSADRQAREALGAQARLAETILRPRLRSVRTADEEQLLRQLGNLDVRAYLVRDGEPDRAGLPEHVVRRIGAGRHFSGRARVDGTLSYVEGRTVGPGEGVVLTRPIGTGVWRQVLAGLWLPLGAGLAAGIGAGWWLARRLARPIRSVAVAAARLRAGERGVRVPVEPPREVVELAHAFNGLAEDLAVSEGRQREFLLSVSHELRTPLTAVSGYAEALSDGVVPPEDAARTGRTILQQAQHLDRLVSDLLALARLDAIDFPLAPVPVDLTALLHDIAHSWRPRCEAAGVELRTDLPGEPVRVHADPGRARQVVDGLLDNALRVVPAGAPIVIALQGTVVQIRDGGPGFTDDDLAVVFERGALHQRYRGSRPVGSGIGLALVAGLVRRMGGHVEAGHAPEGGAAFAVSLPPHGGTERLT